MCDKGGKIKANLLNDFASKIIESTKQLQGQIKIWDCLLKKRAQNFPEISLVTPKNLTVAVDLKIILSEIFEKIKQEEVLVIKILKWLIQINSVLDGKQMILE